jgi:hypothetical protein
MIRRVLVVLAVACAGVDTHAANLLGRIPPTRTFAFAPSIEIVRWGESWILPGTKSTGGMGTLGFLAGVGGSPVSPFWGIDGDLRLGSMFGGGWVLAAQPRVWLDPLPHSQISLMPSLDFGLFHAEQWFESEPSEDGLYDSWKATQDVYGLQSGASLTARLGWIFARAGSSWTLVRWIDRDVEPQSTMGGTKLESASSKGWNFSVGLRFPIDHL